MSKFQIGSGRRRQSSRHNNPTAGELLRRFQWVGYFGLDHQFKSRKCRS